MTSDATDDPIARRLARSGIQLNEDDLRHLRSARVALDAALAAVRVAAQEMRVREHRRWPLPPDQ